MLSSLYLQVKDTVSPIMAAADCCALTTACWTSCSNEAYIGVTFHTFTCDVCLPMEELPEHHTAENLAKTTEKVLQDWKLESTKVVGATVDHPTNIQKAIINILHWKSRGCVGHVIKLCERAGLNQPQVHTAIARCSHLVTFFRTSSQYSYCEDIWRIYNTSFVKMLQQDGTRLMTLLIV